MPMYMIERQFAEQIDMTPELAAGLKEVNDSANVRWVKSFLSADRRKTFCMYEAASPDALREAAEKAGIPADSILEIGSEMFPTGETKPIENG